MRQITLTPTHAAVFSVFVLLLMGLAAIQLMVSAGKIKGPAEGVSGAATAGQDVRSVNPNVTEAAPPHRPENTTQSTRGQDEGHPASG